MHISFVTEGFKRLLILKIGKRPRFFGFRRWQRQYYALLSLHEALKGTKFYEGGTFVVAGSEIRLRVDPRNF